MITLQAECVLRTDAVLGEGPVWDAARACLWWVDIEKKELHCFEPAAGEDRLFPLPERIGFAVPTDRGDLIIGQGNRLARFDPTTAALTPFCAPEAEPADNRFNDAKFDPAGRLWAGTMAVSEAPDRGTLYRIDPLGAITRMLTPVSISNGLAWSPDARTMFFVDSPTRRVAAFDFELETGAIENRRTVIETTESFPDGMCSDAAGNLWIALWGGWSVACFDPRTGTQLAKIEVPVERVTSCCFGGEKGQDLYITTASRDLTSETRARQPLAGSVFVAKPSTARLAAC